MKKHKKEEILRSVRLLERAGKALGKKRRAGVPQLDGSELMELLKQCQEMAIEVGNELESCKEGREIVRLLEDYCEDIYKISLCADDFAQRMRILGQARQRLKIMEDKICNELPTDKKEIVFLPYKASMWDSLEGIFQAAKEDETCEAFVIPVPYFDKNPDGSLGQIHEEGGDYPDDVPVTSWRTYDIQARRPDVIYIHNPYDQYNHVTSVHPAFYAQELRKHTDMLVYVPYFTAINEKTAKHFCIVPGVLYAHRVIVQSESVRKAYLEEFKQFERTNKCKNAFGRAEEKFMALGSPKHDQVLKTGGKDFKIPEEWKQLITDRDGTRKKVILYNTTVDAMLKQSEKMLDKIRHTLAVFEQNREAVLLWRPHPLLKTTLKSMRPELLEEYLQIEDRYRTAGFGILDETPNLHRAIWLSDAYYGDWSSVLELYKKTGKPVIKQSCDIKSKTEDGKILAECFFIEKDRCYASAMNQNGLYLLTKNGKAEFLHLFPGEKLFKRFLFSSIAKYKEFLVFAPESAEHICIYNTDSGEFITKEIPAPSACRGYQPNFKFGAVIFFEGCFFFIPQTYPAVIKMKALSWELDYLNEWVTEEAFCFKKGYSLYKNFVTIPSALSDMMLKLDMAAGRAIIERAGWEKEEKGAWTLCENEKECWAISYPDSHILCTNKDTEIWNKIDDYPSDFEGNGYPFAIGFMKRGIFYACPVKANMMLKADTCTGQVQKADIKGMIVPGHTLMYLSKDQRFLLFSRFQSDKSLWSDENVMQVFLDTETMEAFECRFWIENKNIRDNEIFQTYLAKKEVIIENGQFQLSWLLAANISPREHERQELCSARIHKEIGRLL